MAAAARAAMPHAAVEVEAAAAAAAARCEGPTSRQHHTRSGGTRQPSRPHAAGSRRRRRRLSRSRRGLSDVQPHLPASRPETEMGILPTAGCGRSRAGCGCGSGSNERGVRTRSKAHGGMQRPLQPGGHAEACKGHFSQAGTSPVDHTSGRQAGGGMPRRPPDQSQERVDGTQRSVYESTHVRQQSRSATPGSTL